MSATAGVAVDWLCVVLLSIGIPPVDGDRLLGVEGWGARVCSFIPSLPIIWFCSNDASLLVCARDAEGSGFTGDGVDGLAAVLSTDAERPAIDGAVGVCCFGMELAGPPKNLPL